MCFSPKVSLLTALIEFVVAIALVVFYKSSFLIKFLAVFLFALGMYQFSEFMLCSTKLNEVWGTIAFLSYNVLPAMGLHFSLRYPRGETSFIDYLVYIPAVVFGGIAVFTNNFILESSCLEVFVLIKTTVFRSINSSPIFTYSYLGYYFGYIVLSCVFFAIANKKIKDESKRKVCKFAGYAISASLVPALILMVAFPSFGIVFPSMYCEFAILFTVFVVFGMSYSDEFEVKALKDFFGRGEA